MKRNPYQVSLLVFAGFCWVLAYVLAGALGELTDVEIYDVAGAEALSSWIYLLVGVGATALVGAVIIAGVDWSLRRRSQLNAEHHDLVRSIPAPESVHVGINRTGP